MKARVIIFAAIFLYSCGTESTPIYELNVTADPAGAGTVTPDLGEYEEGSDVQITATPNSHWVFSGWQGDVTGTVNPTSVMMDSDKSIIATFEKQEYPLTVLIEGEGTVHREVVSVKTDHPHGTLLQLTATPAEGWLFSTWKGDRNGSNNPLPLTIHRETTLTAVFERKSHEVDIQTTGRGTVEQEIVPGKAIYDHNTMVRFTAIPGTGWGFTGWDGHLSGEENPIEISIDKDYSITANFEEIEYTIDTDVKGNGNIVITPHRDKYRYGQLVRIEAEPDDQWAFQRWSGDVTGSTNPERVIIDKHLDITAEFRRRPAELELYECSTRCSGPFIRDRKLPLPYSSGTMAYISTNSNTVTVGRFYLKAIAESFTIIDVSATDTRRITSARISGLSNGTVIKPGETVEFSLESGRTHGRQAGIRYQFKIRETGQTFRYNANLTTN